MVIDLWLLSQILHVPRLRKTLQLSYLLCDYDYNLSNTNHPDSLFLSLIFFVCDLLL